MSATSHFLSDKHQILNVIVMQILQYNSVLLLKHYCRNTNRNCTFAVVELLYQCKQLDIRNTRCIGLHEKHKFAMQLQIHVVTLLLWTLAGLLYLYSTKPHLPGATSQAILQTCQFGIETQLYHPVGPDSPNNMVWCMSTCQRGRKWMGWQGVKVLQFSTVFCFPYNSTPRSQAKERQ